MNRIENIPDINTDDPLVSENHRGPNYFITNVSNDHPYELGFFTLSPSGTPTESKTPSISPSSSNIPSAIPSISVEPTHSPSLSTQPTTSHLPSLNPSRSNIPSVLPTLSQTPTFSSEPSHSPSISTVPSVLPSYHPSTSPSLSSFPTEVPSLSTSPTDVPSHYPSLEPSNSSSPSSPPSLSTSPSEKPSSSPSSIPSSSLYPSSLPSLSHAPSNIPTASGAPSGSPSLVPSGIPSMGTSRSCPKTDNIFDEGNANVDYLTFDYEVAVAESVDVGDVLPGLEAAMLDHLTASFLLCNRRKLTNSLFTDRRMIEENGIIALDSSPEDELDDDIDSCTAASTTENCSPISGFMTVTTCPSCDVPREEILQVLKESMDNDIYISRELLEVAFVGERIPPPPTSIVKISKRGGSNTILIGFSVMLALCLLAGFFLFAFYRKRVKNSEEIEQPETDQESDENEAPQKNASENSNMISYSAFNSSQDSVGNQLKSWANEDGNGSDAVLPLHDFTEREL